MKVGIGIHGVRPHFFVKLPRRLLKFMPSYIIVVRLRVSGCRVRRNPQKFIALIGPWDISQANLLRKSLHTLVYNALLRK